MKFLVYSLLALKGVLSSELKNVREGDLVELKCRFAPPSDLPLDSTDLTWIRNKAGQYDNVAIGEKAYSQGYTIHFDPKQGVYDLHIDSATYEQDNGQFECRFTQSGSGNKLHSSLVELVVLLPPGPPTIKPNNSTVTESKHFNLTCASSGGSPPPEIVWYKNGERGDFNVIYTPATNKEDPTTSVLTYSPMKEDDMSSFKCTVWNRAIPESNTMEAATNINVNYFPRVSVEPENPIRVERDETAELLCRVDAKPAVNEVKWMRNGRFISVNFKHMIPRASLKDAGPYTCKADNGLGKVVEKELELDVLFAPEVSVPSMREFSETEEILVDCNVTANPPAHSIVWTKEGDASFRQVDSPLRLPASKGAAVNNGKYTCTATNFIQPTGRQRMQRAGNSTINIAVKHAPGPAFITPETPNVLEGGRVTMVCGAAPPGYPIPTYKWWKEGSSNTVLATGASFTIDSARINSGGRYFCQPSNIAGTGATAETILNVYQAPALDIQLKQEIVKRSGDTGYHVTCAAEGKPKPVVVWYKNNVEIQGDTSDHYQISVKEIQNRNNQAVNVISTLSFIGPQRISKENLMATDRGHYTCQFKNEVGEANSTMLLRIEHSPVVIHQHNKVAANVGETALIVCRMQAYPRLRFEWSKGNSLLTSRPSMTTTELGDDVYQGVLTIPHVNEGSYGEYACKASNQLGAQKTLITLQPKGKPEKPRELRAAAKSFGSILLEWTEGFNGGFNQTTFNVEYTDGTSDPEYVDCRQQNPCNISGLEQYTKYTFKVNAVNIMGTTSWSHPATLETDVDVAKIPRAEHVFYETSSKTVSFNVVNYPLGLVAKIELENPDTTYRPHSKLGMADRTFGQMEIVDQDVLGLRVRLCLSTDEELCGDYGLAEVVEVRQYSYTNASGLPLEGVIAIVIFAVILALAAIALVVKCCFCSNPKPKKLTKDDIAGPNRLNGAQQYNNYGLDSKGTNAKDVADSPDIIKSQMYGYNYQPAAPGAQVAPHGYDSTSNSNNGGSVNSQDSLWNVKHPVTGMPMDPAVNGYIGAGYFADQHPSQQQYNIQQYNNAQQYGQQQYNGAQYNTPQYNQYNYEEYTHYPHPEEYLASKGYVATNGDQYAAPNKHHRNRLDSDYSPYGDVSGLPDPYTGHDISAELRVQDGLSLASEEAPPPPEGYSTPSRRVIREIIV